MMLRKIRQTLLPALVLAVALLAPAAAHAGIVACMWDTTLPENRAAFFKSIADGANEETLLYDDGFEARWRSACSPRDEKVVKGAQVGLSGYAHRIAFVAALKEKFGVDEPQIQAAWDNLPGDVRNPLGHKLVEVLLGRGDLAVSEMETFRGVGNSLGIRSPDGLTLVAGYFLYKALNDLGEAMLASAGAAE